MERALYAVIGHHQRVGISKSEMAAEVGISLFETFAHNTFLWSYTQQLPQGTLVKKNKDVKVCQSFTGANTPVLGCYPTCKTLQNQLSSNWGSPLVE
jgi:hypothetical protein